MSEIVLSAGLPSLRVGDIAITTKTALVVTEVTPPASDGSVTVRGRMPELQEVFKTLKISISDYALSPSQFTPADGVTVVAGEGRAVALGAKPLAVTPNLSLTLTKKFSPNLEGTLALSMAPSVDVDIDHEAVHGTIAFRSPITVTPKINFTGSVGFQGEYEVGSYSIPIVTPLTPLGVIALKVPVIIALNATAGKVSASIGVGATADYGVTLMIEPSGLDLKETGAGFSFTPAGTNLSSFELAAAASLDVRVKTGVSLSTFFGTAEPIWALVSAGAKADLLYAKLATSTSTGASEFNVSCMTGTLAGVSDAKAGANFFGLKAIKATAGISIPLTTYSPVPGCTAFTITANPSTIFSGQLVEFTATMPNSGLFPSPPTGTVAFSLASSGVPLCTQALDASGNAKCSAKVDGAFGSTVPIEALYQGSSKFAGGVTTGAVSISSTLALELTPINASVAKGSTVQLSVIAKDSGGNIVPTPAGLQWTGDAKVSVDQNGLVTANLAGDAVVRVTDPVSRATAQVLVKVYGLHPFNYTVSVRNIKCGQSVTLAYSMSGGGDSFAENFSYTAVPCVPVALDTFQPRAAVPIQLRANTKYTLTMTAAGSGFLPNITDAFVEFDSTLVGFFGIVRTGIGIPGTYTVEFTTPP